MKGIVSYGWGEAFYDPMIRSQSLASTPPGCELPKYFWVFFLPIQVRMARLDWSWEPAYLRDIVGKTTKKTKQRQKEY